MGNLLYRVMDALSDSAKPRKIIMIGLDAAGKTTIMYKLKLNEVVSSVPTIGFNVEEIKYKKLRFTCWDIGGQEKIRNLWSHYYDNTSCIIYVLDASDNERLELASQTLNDVLGREQLQDTQLLVFANKMDMATLTIPEIAQKLNLHQLRRQWNIQGTCALTGEGLHDGLEWISKTLKQSKK